MKKRIILYCLAAVLTLSGCSCKQSNLHRNITWEEIEDYPCVMVYANDSLQIYDHVDPEKGEHYLAYYIGGSDEAIVCKRINSDGTLYREPEGGRDEEI